MGIKHWSSVKSEGQSGYRKQKYQNEAVRHACPYYRDARMA